MLFTAGKHDTHKEIDTETEHGFNFFIGGLLQTTS